MIKIFTFSANRPDFISLQADSFRKHLQEDFEFVVFNNAKFNNSPGGDYAGIHAEAKKAGAQVIDVQKDPDLIVKLQAMEPTGPLFNPAGLYSNANVAHAYALCHAWYNHISKERGAVAIFDSDVFLIEPLKLTDILGSHHMVNVPDGKTHDDGRVFHYMWPTFMLADMSRLPDPETLCWWCGRIEGTPVDVGGQTYHYFRAHPELDIYETRKLNSYYLNTSGCDFQPADYDEFYPLDKTILHYRSGSNWNYRDLNYHLKKLAWLKKRIG